MKNHNWNLRTNMTMLTDLYELTMMNGYLQNEMKDRRACFDLFFRSVPESGGYAIMAGVQQMIDYLSDLKFEDEDIDYLESLQIFEPDFIEYLENFEFACDVWAIPEGTPIFPENRLSK